MSPEQNRVQQRLPRFGSHLHSAEYVQKVYVPKAVYPGVLSGEYTLIKENLLVE